MTAFCQHHRVLETFVISGEVETSSVEDVHLPPTARRVRVEFYCGRMGALVVLR
jgi:hypothetical protein